MKKIVVGLLALVGLAALVDGGVYLWAHRPWRVAVQVNGRPLVWRELDLRARTLLDDARRTEHLTLPKEREGEALNHYRRQAAKMWIVKEVMLAEAVARGIEVGVADEKEAMARVTTRLKLKNLTPEQFFKEGPLPEELKRRDFREGVLIGKFTDREVLDKIHVTTQEIDARQNELKQLALIKTKPGGRPAVKSDRKTAIDMLRAERFQKGFRDLFRTLFAKADVKCPEFPDLEELNAVSPPRTEDAAPAHR